MTNPQEKLDVKGIQELIRFVSKSGVSEVSLEQGDFKLTIKTGREAGAQPQVQYIAQAPPQQMQMPAQPQAAQPAAESAAAPAAQSAPGESKGTPIKSPMIGTFYGRPSPDKEPFVKVGDKVEKGQVVCIIEAMKLFNEIESEISGTVLKVLVNESTPVEYDQPLFLIG